MYWEVEHYLYKSPATALESSHRFFDNWPITSIAERLTSTAKLNYVRKVGLTQSRVLIVCKGEAAFASD
jgi:hypothetical protein